MEFEDTHNQEYEKILREYNKRGREIITSATPGLIATKCEEIILPHAVNSEPRPGMIVSTAEGLKVFDADGSVRVSMGIWGDDLTIPRYIDNDEQEADMDFTNPDVLKERLLRDKAIIAMHVLRVTKPAGPQGKGIGPNREDHPLFREVVHMWLNGDEITGEKLEKVESARQRVTKYGKQLTGSRFNEVVTDPQVTRGYTIEFVRDAYKQNAEAELAEAIKGETYGGW